jgi:hypothetical protein
MLLKLFEIRLVEIGTDVVFGQGMNELLDERHIFFFEHLAVYCYLHRPEGTPGWRGAVSICLFAFRQNSYLSDMRIEFRTKEQAKREQEEAFLALSGEERMREFFALSRRIMREYPSAAPRDYGDNLVLELRSTRPEPHE